MKIAVEERRDDDAGVEIRCGGSGFSDNSNTQRLGSSHSHFHSFCRTRFLANRINARKAWTSVDLALAPIAPAGAPS
jgi:hypothetical protein